ncbi:MAG: hypothetical protein GY791_04145 [Alphaproteobacteria bacterium]|nr:hypothetical protein [Alphaproteobacteria bacterium]
MALVGAVGTDLNLIVQVLTEELRNTGYNPSEIRLSKLISECYAFRSLKAKQTGAENKRIDAHMNAGNSLRKRMDDGSAVSLLTVREIRQIRENLTGKPNEAIAQKAYILNSLKHPDEIKILRKIYGPFIFVISAYAPREERIDRLSKLIAKSVHSSDKHKFRNDSESLVEKDAKEIANPLGQNVRDTFPAADFFVRMGLKEEIRKQIKRFISLLFRQPYITPNIDEYGMFLAHTASLRSADLSRQVGSVILTERGEVLATGCNEVPKAGGGAIWEGTSNFEKRDYRDFRLGYDSSSRVKEELIAEIFNEIKPWLSDRYRTKTPKALVNLALYDGIDDQSPPLKNARVANILEFGRMVHAEMYALTEAARLGNSVKSAHLYSTTFPCHMCARHIISSGLARVVYIEPYPKSLAKELYNKSINVDGDMADDDAVIFEPFMGISPRRYGEFFAMRDRKDEKGNALDWNPAKSKPIISENFVTYLDAETAISAYLDDKRIEFGLVRPTRRKS